MSAVAIVELFPLASDETAERVVAFKNRAMKELKPRWGDLSVQEFRVIRSSPAEHADFFGIDDDSGADQVGLAGVQDARGHDVQHRGLALDHQRVTRVIAALKPSDETRVLGKPVYDLAFSFIAPLGAYCYDGRHG